MPDHGSEGPDAEGSQIKQLVCSAAVAVLEQNPDEFWRLIESNRSEQIPEHFIARLREHFSTITNVKVKRQWDSSDMGADRSFGCLPLVIEEANAQRIAIAAAVCELPPESYVGPQRFPQHLAQILEIQASLSAIAVDARYVLIVLRGYMVNLSAEDEAIARMFHNHMFVDWATLQLQAEKGNPLQAAFSTVESLGWTKPYLGNRCLDFCRFVYDAHLAVIGLGGR